MGVQLSSLRVTADMDSSTYVTGAKQIVAANDLAGQSATRYVDANGRLVTSTMKAVTGFGSSQAAMLSFQQQVQQNSQAMILMTQQMAAMNENTDGWGSSIHRTGLEVVQTASHLRTLGLAAYALSPAFRDLVNPAVAASVRAIGPAAASAAGTVIGVLSPALALIGRIAIPVGIAVEAFKAMSAITELGAEKLKEFNKIATDAGGDGVSTDFFQQQAAGAKEFGLDANLATEALKKFQQVDTAQLGGSAFQQRLDQLTKAGNFSGNSGVSELKQATDVESRYRAATDLINQAMEAGQRLAGLDLASKFLPPELLERLRTSGTTLKDIQTTADEIKPADIVSQEQIAYAVQLKTRLDDANEVIANKFKPVQKDLTQLGLNYQESWVSIVEIMAGGVTKANDLYSALKGIPGLFAQAGNAPFWSQLTDFTGRLGLNSTPESMGLKPINGPDDQRENANARLGALLQNPNAVQQNMRQATTIQSAIRGDSSKNPATPQTQEADDKVDAAINALRKHTETQIADANAAGLGAAALARFRAEAQETAAVQANGGKETAEQASQFKILQQRASDAAEALEKAKIATSINFNRNTALLSPEDVTIASELKQLYPNVADALNSAEAAQIKFNTTVKSLSNSIQSTLVSGLTDIATGAVTAGKGFQNMGAAIVKSLEEMLIKMEIVEPIAKSLQSSFSGFGFGGFGGASAALPLPGAGNFIGPVVAAGGGHVTGPGSGTSDSIPARLSNGEFVVNAKATAQHLDLLHSINAKGFAAGGAVGNVVPFRGANAGGSGDIHFHSQIVMQGGSTSTDPIQAKMIAKETAAQFRSMIQNEMVTQSRPGGILRSRAA